VKVYALSGVRAQAQKRVMQAYLRLVLCADRDQQWYFSCCSYRWVSRDKSRCLERLSRGVERPARWASVVFSRGKGLFWKEYKYCNRR
jgi:hypothetical protein